MTRIIPIPPTRWTSKLFSTRALTPRSQKTIFPAAAAVSVFSWQRRAGEAGVPNVTSWPVAEPVPADAPLYVTPSIVAEPAPTRSCVSAATVVIHGLGCATVDDGRAVVAGRGGDEDARRGGVQERDLDAVEEVRSDVPLIE